MNPSQESSKKRKSSFSSLNRINANAAGIDISSENHYVAVPEDRDEQPVRKFGNFTCDLYALADWLKHCRITTVAMESTGVYWVPVFNILEECGFEVYLVNARHVKHVPGKKSDVQDCQWLQQLHSYGLLSPSFHPAPAIRRVRSYWRQRDMLLKGAASHIQHMQKALEQMNIQLHKVLSDLTGTTGMSIIHAILQGERDPQKLAQMKHPQIRSSEATIAQALQGNYAEEHLFSLRQAVELYDIYQSKIQQCDAQIEQCLRQWDSKVDPEQENHKNQRKPKKAAGNAPSFALTQHLHRISGVDLTQIDGISSMTAMTIISEWGLDMSKFPTEKHLGSWLGLAPNNQVSGDKVLRSKSKKVVSRSATALRMAASSLKNSKSALGAYYRRMKAKLGAPKAITATAYKLARLAYRLLKYGTPYVDIGMERYEQQYRERTVRYLKRKAKELGLEVIENTTVPQPVS